MKNYYVYKHTNKINNEVYIGITSQQPKDRWDKGYGYCNQPIFYNSIKKYGWDNFSHEILFEGLTKEQAAQKEKELIAFYKSNRVRYPENKGLNATDGGETVSPTFTRKINQYDLYGNFIKTWDSIAAAAEATNIHRDTIKGCLTGRIKRAGQYMWTYFSGDPEQKIKGYKVKKPERKLGQYDLEGNLIKVWDSAKEVTDTFGYSATGISLAANGKKATARGYIWRYAEELAEKIEVGSLNKCKRPVNQYDLEGNFIKAWDCAHDARKTLNIQHITEVCSGRRKQAGGFIWRYAE